MIIVLMGVAGSGKTTIGGLLSRRLGWTFFDADDFHPEANVAKMAAGVGLEDEDRWPWLERVRDKIKGEIGAARPAVFACSALKRSYREFLVSAHPEVKLVYLRGEASVIAARIAARSGHFMKEKMLASQLAALEEPSDCAVVDVSASPEEIVEKILRHLSPET